ncbi:hypothetical protein NDU88_003603 [Pleurodeles waltl]|uniref:Uncharacterized protein n=1 Tax=Pleurodeles waltl TaxID=8319 RepID=A0AAV7TP63_PLEWA|nr:hypothetical protein NDU88_003603 [Pleurodeles waltl]
MAHAPESVVLQQPWELGCRLLLEETKPVLVPEPPRDFVVWSLFNVIFANYFCCLGLLALIFSVKARPQGLEQSLMGGDKACSLRRETSEEFQRKPDRRRGLTRTAPARHNHPEIGSSNRSEVPNGPALIVDHPGHPGGTIASEQGGCGAAGGAAGDLGLRGRFRLCVVWPRWPWEQRTTWVLLLWERGPGAESAEHQCWCSGGLEERDGGPHDFIPPVPSVDRRGRALQEMSPQVLKLEVAQAEDA